MTNAKIVSPLFGLSKVRDTPRIVSRTGGSLTEGDQIDSLVRQINVLCRRAKLEFALQVGMLVVDNFYGGRLDNWRRRGAKNVSFRKLAEHPDLAMSASSLYRTVAIYEICERIGAKALDHLSIGHVRAVLGLPDDSQKRLLLSAEEEMWTVRRLATEVASRAGEVRKSRGGRKAQTRIKKTVRRLRECIDETGVLVGAEGDWLEPQGEDASEVIELLRRIREACSHCEQRLQQYVPQSRVGS